MEEQAQAEAVPSGDAAPKEESLNDVLDKFPVEDAAQSFTAKPKQEEKAPEFNVPDPSYDPDGFKSTIKGLASNDWEVKQTLNRISSQLQGEAKRRQRESEEADISKTVGRIQEKLPILKDKDRLVKGYLGAIAAEDPRVAKVWENRARNPEAWKKTEIAIMNQMAKDFEFNADTQLTENTRAAKASRDQMATTQKEGPDDKIKQMSPGDFEKYWGNLVNS